MLMEIGVTLYVIYGHCNHSITVVGEYGKYYIAAAPKECPNGCKGKPYAYTTNISNLNFSTYQEIKIMVRKYYSTSMRITCITFSQY